MKNSSLARLEGRVVVRRFYARIRREAGATAHTLRYLAEMDARKLYRDEGYSSLFDLCTRGARWSRDEACLRINVARAARAHPALHDALLRGRLHLSGADLLAPKLAPGNADELIAAALDRSKDEIASMLAVRFPKPDLPTRIECTVFRVPNEPERCAAIASEKYEVVPEPLTPAASVVPAPSTAAAMAAAPGSDGGTESPAAPALVLPPAPRPRVEQLSAERFGLQVTVPASTHAKLRRAQDLLAHVLPPGDVAGVLDRALDALIEKLEKRKFAATPRPRPRTSRGDSRYVPAAVRREVAQRDGGRCTFVAPDGRRCEATSRLEYDHVHPAGRGGDASSAANLRLRCRAHNQLAAERTYGERFMQAKRERGRTRRPGPRDELSPAARLAHARGQSPADVLQSRAAAATARARLDEMLRA